MSDTDQTDKAGEESVIQALTARVNEIENARERGIAALITAVILAGLIIGSSPAAAVSTSVSGPGEVDLADGTSDTVELTYEVDIEEGERIPAEGVQFDIAEAGGDDTATVSVDLATNEVVVGAGDDAGAINTSLLAPELVGVTTNYPSGETLGYGYGYGDRTGTEFGYGYESEVDFGFGYGYSQNGYGYSDTATPTEFNVTVAVDKAAFAAGAAGEQKDYTVTGSVVTEVTSGYSVGDISQTVTNFDTAGEGTGHTFSVLQSDTTAPEISGFTATNPAAQDITVTITSDEQLDAISVAITGPDPATLTAASFDGPADGGGVYTATYVATSNGDYTATLNTAADAVGNDGSDANTADVSISADTKSAPVSGGQATAEFGAGATVQSADVSGLPAGVGTVTFEDFGTSNPSSDDLPVDNVGVYLDITPDTSVSGSVTITATVPNATVSGIDNPTMYHNPGSGWEELSTTTTVTSSGTQLTATTNNGLSPFAIAAATTSSPSGGSTSPSSSGGGGGGGSVSTDFTVSELAPEEADVTQGTEITVSATVTTTSYLEESQDVELRLDGDTVATQEVTLSSRDSTTVAFENVDTSELEGEYEHGIFTEDDSETGTLTVTAAADEEATAADDDSAAADEEATDEETAADDEAADGETEDGTPGFGVIVGIIALVSLALLARRRLA